MAFQSASFINSLLALQICVVLMIGSLDSTTSFGPVTEPKPMAPTPPTPPKHQIAVEGVAFCKSCKFGKRLAKHNPLPEAVVRLQCHSRRHPTLVEGKTNKNGYFFIQPPKVTTFSAHRCKVFLISSPLANCKLRTDLNGGVSGASLSFKTKLLGPNPVALYSVGPLAFAPNKTSCPHSP